MNASSGLILRGFLLISAIAFGLETMAEATQQTGGTVEVNRGTSKREWPEVLGLAVEEAEQKIKEDMPMAVLQVLPENSFVTMDFNQRRVRIFVDESRKVVKTPRVG